MKMSMTDKLLGLTEADREEYARQESEAYAAMQADDEVEEDDEKDDIRATSNASADWREGFLSDPQPVILVEYLPYLENRLAELNNDIPTTQEITELGNRLDNEFCGFQAEMRNGKIYAGREPMKEAD